MDDQASLEHLIKLYEHERQIAAYELHDGLAQFVAGALMHLETSSQLFVTDPQRAAVEFELGVNLLREAAQESRRLIDGLRPPVLDERGIGGAVEQLVTDARQAGLDVEFDNRTQLTRLASPLETALFRVVQEALTNVRRHSGTPKARVELTQIDGRVRATIQDWGTGFDPDHVEGRRVGLQGIHERARLLGGQATIDSQPGAGTTIVVELPLIERDDSE
jgi:signal transduction histidine kinase